MSSVGIDIGSKNTIIGKWIEDPYRLSSEGISSCVSCDNGKNIAETCLLFGKEVTANDMAFIRCATYPKSSVFGCFQYFPVLSVDEMFLEGDFSPSSLCKKDGVTYFKLEVAGSKTKEISVFVPFVFYLEYISYRALRNDKEMLNQRQSIAHSQRRDGYDWYALIPDRFGDREIDMVKAPLEWEGFTDFTLLKSCIAPVLEYGCHDCMNHGFKKPQVCLFVDSGDSHTSFTVVEFFNSTVTVLYASECKDVCGKKCTAAMMKLLCGEHLDELKENRKSYIRCLRTAEKEKCNLNYPGIEDVYVDLTDYFEDEEFEDDICVTKDDFVSAIDEMVNVFDGELQKITEIIQSRFHKKIDCVVPVGGNMRIEILKETLLTRITEHNPKITQLTQTLNMDECFVMGATLLGHLIDKGSIFVNPSVVNTLIFPTSKKMSDKLTRLHKEECKMEITLHPECILDFPSTPHQSFEQFKEECLCDCEHIHTVEKEMVSMNAWCVKTESLLNQVSDSLTQKKEYDTTPSAFVEGVKEQMMNRYHLPSFPLYFTCEEKTKRSVWWKKNELRLNQGVMAVSSSLKELKACYDQVYSSIYKTSRTKLSYDKVIENYKQLSSVYDAFIAGCSLLENRVGLIMYQCAKRVTRRHS